MCPESDSSSTTALGAGACVVVGYLGYKGGKNCDILTNTPKKKYKDYTFKKCIYCKEKYPNKNIDIIILTVGFNNIFPSSEL